LRDEEPQPIAATDGLWCLYVPFSAPKLTFTDPLAETVSGYAATFTRVNSEYGRIVVEGLPSPEETERVFAALKRGVVAASVELSTGIRVVDGLAILYDDNDPLPQQRDQPFACPQGRNLARLVISIGPTRFNMPKILDKLRASLHVGFYQAGFEEALADPRTTLACQLFIDGHFEATSEARFLSLMGVLEVLKDKDSVSEAALQLVDQWISESAQLVEVEAKSFSGTLRHMKEISINRGIQSRVGRHLGPDKALVAKRLYGIRSKLVHDGLRPDDLEDIVRKTESLVRELLVSILTAASASE
jgi:hypothetical protein